MTVIPEDVEARAKAAALSSWMSNPGVHALNGLVDFYLSCYTAERPRIELAALKARVKEVCWACAIGERYPLMRSAGGHLNDDNLTFPCVSEPLHARIAQLKEEIEKGG